MCSLKDMGKLKIRTQLLLFFALSMVVMLLIILATYYQSVDIIDENNAQYINQSIYQISQELTSKCNILEKLAQSIAFNSITQTYIYNENSSEEYESILKLWNYLAGQMAIDDSIIDICIFPENGSSLDVTGMKYHLERYLKDITIESTMDFYGLVKIKSDNKTINGLLLVSNIYPGSNRYDFGTNIGKVVIVLDADKISKNVLNMNKVLGADFYLIDKDGIIYTSNNRNRVGQRMDQIIGEPYGTEGAFSRQISGMKYNVYIQKFGKYDWQIISTVPMDKLLHRIKNVRKFHLIIVIISIVLLTIPLSLILKSIVNPLKRISAFMDEVKNGDLKALKNRISLDGHMEVRNMADHFNEMINEIDSLTHRLLDANSQLYELEITKKQAELAFLQNQINPHFLYNTLECIKGIALYRKVPEIRDIAQSLAEIFRYSIRGDDMVKLETELDTVISYLKIMQIRFPERFDVQYQVSPDTLHCFVPKMILQPIVENAIYHGIELNDGFGHLIIVSRILDDEILELIIEDNGIGLDYASLDRINSLLKSGTIRKREVEKFRIGLENVNNRIRLQYGNEYGLVLESKPSIGTKVIYLIPVRRIHNVEGTHS